MNRRDRFLLSLLGLCARAIGMLPYRVKYYGMVPLICFVIHRVVGYRKRVVRENLANSFPEKSPQELRKIEKEFYLHLSELFIDTLELYTISEEELRARFRYLNMDELDRAIGSRSWIAAMAHYGDWEYTVGFPLFSAHRVAAVYKPLHNRVMEEYYRIIRSRFGTEPIPMQNITRELLLSERVHKKPLVVALIADQTPTMSGIPHWFPFLHRPTLFFMGMERLAVRLGLPVHFLDVRKVKRGY